MRLLVLLAGLSEDTGGIQRYSRHLVRALGRCVPDAELDILLLRDSRNDVPATGSLGLDPGKTRIRPCGGHGLASKPAFAFRAILHGLFRRPTAVVCGHVNFLPVALLLKRLFGIPFIFETYGWELQQVRRETLREGAKEAVRIHAISRFTADRVVEFGSADRSKISIVPVPVDFEKFTPGPRPAGLSARWGLDEKKVILTVSRLNASERYKGHDQVLAALKMLSERGCAVSHVVVGDGDDRPRLEALSRTLGLGEHVIFAGSVQPAEAADYYRLCDAFVMPSRWEGFGIVYVEALGCGKPVVGGRGDGARDALLDGRLGLLVDPDSPSEIADAIEALLNGRVKSSLTDPALLRETAKAHFSPEVFEAKMKESLAVLWEK